MYLHQDENANPSPLASPIQDFYTDAKILITGATGFIGKALVEKLLRSCLNIKTIYILIRTKRGLNPDSRHEKLLENSVFDTIREENPALFKKIVSISGDVSEPNLGMSECDWKMLTDEVDIVFHSAATVRFNEKLKDAVRLNTLGTIKVIQLCREMKNLKSFIHVSTAYSNADKYEVLESVYPSPADLEEVLKCCEEAEVERESPTEKAILGNHPNTYTVTKAMAEHIIATQANDLPVSIVRPSIVTGAWKEPVPGWVDNVSGISGIMVEIGRGTLRSIICDESLIMDVIPVDIVVNTLITAAWQTARHKTSEVRVYNCTSGTLNPVLWHDYGRITERHAKQLPSKYVQWYPGFSFRTNRVAHWFVELFLQFIPALLVDMVMYLSGMKPIMFTIARKFKKACKNGEFFALHEWRFQCDNMVMLNRDISDKNDKNTFEVDITRVDWDDYVRNYMIGLRKFVLKDPLESLSRAKTKLNRIYWGTKIVQVLVVVFLCRICYSWLSSVLNYT